MMIFIQHETQSLQSWQRSWCSCTHEPSRGIFLLHSCTPPASRTIAGQPTMSKKQPFEQPRGLCLPVTLYSDVGAQHTYKIIVAGRITQPSQHYPTPPIYLRLYDDTTIPKQVWNALYNTIHMLVVCIYFRYSLMQQCFWYNINARSMYISPVLTDAAVFLN